MENIVVALKESRTPIPLAGMNQADQDLAVYIASLFLTFSCCTHTGSLNNHKYRFKQATS